MNIYQTQEAEKSLPLLTRCREHLDNAMYRMGDINTDDPQYHRIRAAYDHICAAIDQF